MERPSVLIVEDEDQSSHLLKEVVSKSGYRISACCDNYEQALDSVYENRPSIALVDIELNGDKDGIALSWKLRQFNIPSILITSHLEEDYFERARFAKPHAFLSKPIDPTEVRRNLALALDHQETAMEQGDEQLFVKTEKEYKRIRYDEISWIQADGNYVHLVVSTDDRYMIRARMKDMVIGFGKKGFIRIHKSYMVNKKLIEAFSSNYVRVGGAQLPVARNYQQKIAGEMGLLV